MTPERNFCAVLYVKRLFCSQTFCPSRPLYFQLGKCMWFGVSFSEYGVMTLLTSKTERVPVLLED